MVDAPEFKDAVDLKVALDQYNKQINFLRDQSQKAIAALLVFLGYYHALTPTGNASSALTVQPTNVQYACIFVSVFPVVLFGVLQLTNRTRCRQAYALVGEVAARETKVGLEQMGIWPNEPDIAFLTWSGAFAIIYLAFLTVLLLDCRTTAISAVTLVVLAGGLSLVYRYLGRAPFAGGYFSQLWR
jgi:hypothetical protein